MPLLSHMPGATLYLFESNPCSSRGAVGAEALDAVLIACGATWVPLRRSGFAVGGSLRRGQGMQELWAVMPLNILLPFSIKLLWLYRLDLCSHCNLR